MSHTIDGLLDKFGTQISLSDDEDRKVFTTRVSLLIFTDISRREREIDHDFFMSQSP